ncbi:exodeoxyribonuclease VII small subunit [Brachybacterium avium]|uniref:Exodeoxyribonuclease 7 small subunit n=1 Tax=Brachybacterium avium TaxID=2017485 RepID=A0A220UAG2_9MICO|nr:exodeoxyribonuclease VII small subunit [Brachybacterium avium]ASK65107.1 exodeoxyribonuclease VII small subunit [Brachybacterium avium]
MTPHSTPETDLDTAEDGSGTARSGPVTPAEGAQPLPADIAELSYEAARDQLVEVVRRLESGQGGLEDSIGLWERGEMLARRCQQWLDGARERLDDAVAARRSADASDSSSSSVQ